MRVFQGIGKAIHKVKIRLDEPRAWEAFGRWFKSSRDPLLFSAPGAERLAFRAKITAPVLHRDPFAGAAADPARLEQKWTVARWPFVTCYLFQTFPHTRHEFRGRRIRLLGLQRCVFTDVFTNNAFTLYQLFRI